MKTPTSAPYVAVVTSLLVMGGCGAKDKSHGSGPEAARAQLIAAWGASMYSGNSGSGGGAVLEARQQAIVIVNGMSGRGTSDGSPMPPLDEVGNTMTLPCQPQGQMSFDLNFTDSQFEGDTLSMTFDSSGTSTDCGAYKFTGTSSVSGTMTTKSGSGEVSGNGNFSINGSTTLCTQITGQGTWDSEMESSGSGRMTYDGTLTGNCTGGQATCVFDNFTVKLPASAEDIKKRRCEACDIPIESCT